MARTLVYATALCFALTGVAAIGSTQVVKNTTPSFASKCSFERTGVGPGALASPPLPGEANDSNGNIQWVAETSAAGATWQTRHVVTNRSATENVYVHWKPDILETWIPKLESRGPADTSSAPPSPQPGDMHYGKSGKRGAPWYQVPTTAANVPPLRSATSVTLTVLLRGQLRDIFLMVSSQVVRKVDSATISYCIELDPKQSDLTEQLLVNWTSAASSQFRAATKSADGFIRLPRGPAFYEIDVSTAALRDGALVVYDADRQRLAAARVPAFAPPQ
jgi:hypothetical protein